MFLFVCYLNVFLTICVAIYCERYLGQYIFFRMEEEERAAGPKALLCVIATILLCHCATMRYCSAHCPLPTVAQMKPGHFQLSQRCC